MAQREHISGVGSNSDHATPVRILLIDDDEHFTHVLVRFLSEHGFVGEVDFLSLDIDSFDYWLLDALTVTLPPGRSYGSENYAWFGRKLADFAYVDRIVVAEGRRGRGVGRAAYADIFAAVGPGGPPVV